MSPTAQVFTGFGPASPAGDSTVMMMVVERVLDRVLAADLWVVEFDALFEGAYIRDVVIFTDRDAAFRFGRGMLIPLPVDPDLSLDELPF